MEVMMDGEMEPQSTVIEIGGIKILVTESVYRDQDRHLVWEMSQVTLEEETDLDTDREELAVQ